MTHLHQFFLRLKMTSANRNKDHGIQKFDCLMTGKRISKKELAHSPLIFLNNQ